MEKKEKLIIVILFSLSLSAILTNVLGQTTYTCEVKVGDEFIYTVTLTPILPFGPSVGDKKKIIITNITDETDYLTIDFDSWDFISKGESFNSTADDRYWEDVYKDPVVGYGNYFFVLTPVSDYLAAFADTYNFYSSSGNKLIETFNSTRFILTFDSNGIMSKVENEMGGTVVAILSRGDGSSSEIPGYDLPILIGLTAITGVSIIYIVKKKMLK